MEQCEILGIFFLCILILFLQGIHAKCQLGQCTCVNYTHTMTEEFEIQCRNRRTSSSILFKFKDLSEKKKEGIITCFDSNAFVDYDIIPEYKVGDLETLSYRSCPLITNNGFSSILKKLKINKIKAMVVQNISVTKVLFNNFSTMKNLSIDLNRIRLADTILENLPNLKRLKLRNNNIRNVSQNMFQHTPKLQELHLPLNSISHVPDEVFKNLSSLRMLNLQENKLTVLNRYMFTGLCKLEYLDLSHNNIMSLDEDTFAEITGIVTLEIGNNQNLSLSDYVFANFTNLTSIFIDESNLKDLPQHIFEGSNNILNISLKNNTIKDLPGNIFKRLVKLERLNLEGNKITILPNGIFSTLINLKELKLGGNSLTEINEHLFKNTLNLRNLTLSNNNIATVYSNAFINLRMLARLDLSYNQYDGKPMYNFKNCKELQEINLSHNLIEEFPNSNISNKRTLTLNLENNRIKYLRVASLINMSTVKVNNNNISVLNFGEDFSDNNQESFIHPTGLYISNNPITCNCINFDLIRYINGTLNRTIEKMVNINLDKLHCYGPESYKNLAVKDLRPEQITCPLKVKECPKQCTCDSRPYDKYALIDCSNRNLKIAPKIYVTDANIKQIEVNLTGNELETAPYEGLGYDNVTRLFLSNNRITNLGWIPPKIQILTLNGNRLRFIDSKALHSLNESATLRKLTLHRNPWNCDCSTLGLQEFLKYHREKVNVSNVKCGDTGPPIAIKELCQSQFTIVLITVAPILILLVAIAIVVAMYLYYQENIKAWLYAKNLCLWFVTEEELDKDKTFDIFISYSHKDEEFVIQNLLPELEAGPNPFKICIHVRDWVPGEFIAAQITKSVLDSKRTLVILSENFLASVWGKMEFKTAYTEAIREGRVRVIVVKYGSLNEENLDSELQTYLKTNTYVEWSDPRFWNKLKYALPHSRNLK